MISGGNEVKCYRIVHGVGREPQEVERPCTKQEIKAREPALRQPKKSALEIWTEFSARESGKITEALERCAKRFGPTACNR